MKLSEETLKLFRAFAAINQSILIRPDKPLSTVSVSKNVFVEAPIVEEFKNKVAIYDLNRFINVLDLFEEPELNFKDKYVSISSGKQKIDYHYAAENTIVTAPENGIKFPSVDVTIELTEDVLKSINKAAAIIGAPEIAFVGDGETVSLKAIDSSNSSADEFAIDIGEADKEFKVIFKHDNLNKLIANTYTVDISAKGIARFKSDKATFMIAVEQNSSFGG